MSKKDFDEYYQQSVDQYLLLMERLQKLDQEFQNEMIPPERYDEIKQSIQPLLANHSTLSWIKFLLDKPVKKQKYKPYERRQKKLLEQCKGRKSQDIKKENQQVINKFNPKN